MNRHRAIVKAIEKRQGTRAESLARERSPMPVKLRAGPR
jgi:hypothetical protein